MNALGKFAGVKLEDVRPTPASIKKHQDSDYLEVLAKGSARMNERDTGKETTAGDVSMPPKR